MKTKLLKKLRKEARKRVTITEYPTDVFCLRPKFNYIVNDYGSPVTGKIYGGWANGYDKTSLKSAKWYANRLVCRIVQCSATQLKVKRNQSLTKTIKL